MEEAPGHGSHLVEEFDRIGRTVSINGSRLGKEAKMTIDLLGRCKGDTPVVQSVATGSSVPFSEVRGNRTG
jgi:hypothetical protein